MNITANKKYAILLIALIFIVPFSGCDGGRNMDVTKAVAQPEPAVADEPEFEPPSIEIKTEIMPVRAIEVYSSGGRKNTRWYPGVSQSNPNNEFSFKVGGVVSEINFNKGNKILYERVLAKLDSTECQAKVDRLETDLGKLKVELHEAKATHSGAADLQSDLQSLESKESKIRRKRVELQAVLVELGHHEIRFYQRGRVSAVNAKPGDRVEPGQSIMVFDLNDPLQITIEIPVVFLSQIGLSSIGRVKFEGKNGIYPVDVINIGEFSNEPDEKISVTVKLRNPYSYLKPGTATQVAFKFDMRARKKRYILPPGSVRGEGESAFVYIVTPGEEGLGVVEKRTVVAGKVNAQGEEVLQGLTDGELIILNPSGRIKNGMNVKYR